VGRCLLNKAFAWSQSLQASNCTIIIPTKRPSHCKQATVLLLYQCNARLTASKQLYYYYTSATPVENSMQNLIICYFAFALLNSHFLSCIPLQYYIGLLSNDKSRAKFNPMSHKQHAQIVNCKPSTLRSLVHSKYPHQNIINTHRIDTTH
jgi:hypothetical protein